VVMRRMMHAGGHANLGVLNDRLNGHTPPSRCRSMCPPGTSETRGSASTHNSRSRCSAARHEDVHRGLADRIIGALEDVCHHVVDRGGLSTPFFEVPGAGAEHDQPTIAVKC
jgi:hypothetical protein